MTKPLLGRLKRVDLREYWESEESQFTPWLAEEENLSLLGEALGVELELQDQEASVGRFRADLVCRNVADDSLVLIENQLERTDHNHLGQIITYAAGLDAVSIIWIAKKFNEEHRAAIDWLNRISDKDFNFFGLEVELWQIGTSVPAPKFDLVAKPNEWTRTIRDTIQGQLTPAQQMQVKFWGAYGEFLESKGSPITPCKPQKNTGVVWGIGRRHFGIYVTISSWYKFARVSLWLDGPDAKAHFHLLEQKRREIESEVGFSLNWEEKPDQKASSISVQRDVEATEEASWPGIHAWMLETTEDFKRVFGPLVRDLDASDWIDESPSPDELSLEAVPGASVDELGAD